MDLNTPFHGKNSQLIKSSHLSGLYHPTHYGDLRNLRIILFNKAFVKFKILYIGSMVLPYHISIPDIGVAISLKRGLIIEHGKLYCHKTLLGMYLTIILRNRAEYRLILSRRDRRPSRLKSDDIPRD